MCLLVLYFFQRLIFSSYTIDLLQLSLLLVLFMVALRLWSSFHLGRNFLREGQLLVSLTGNCWQVLYKRRPFKP